MLDGGVLDEMFVSNVRWTIDRVIINDYGSFTLCNRFRRLSIPAIVECHLLLESQGHHDGDISRWTMNVGPWLRSGTMRQRNVIEEL